MNKINNEYNKITDFVIPLHRFHLMVKTVIEAIELFYSPRKIYIITPKIYCEKITLLSVKWNINKIITIPEETFFLENYGLNYENIYDLFNKNEDKKMREFGWWYQQLIKLSAFTQIKELSDPFIILDSDLIPLIKWDIYPTEMNPYFKFAILQEKARSEWNMEQYKKSLLSLNLEICDPNIGTFVPHHYVFYHHILKNIKEYIENNESKEKKNFIEIIIELSHKHFRFSEYRLVSSYMKKYFPDLLKYHDFELFGKYGERIRDSINFLKEINIFLDNMDEISYLDFVKFVNKKYSKMPSYLQIEHI